MRLAIVGSGSLLRKTLLEVLAEELPIKNIHLLEIAKDSVRDSVEIKGHHQRILDADNFDFSIVDVVVVLDSENSVDAVVKQSLAAGCKVFVAGPLLEDDKPAIYLNPCRDIKLAVLRSGNLFVIPSSLSLVIAALVAQLEPLATPGYLSAVCLLSVSNRGDAALSELAGQSAGLLNGKPVKPRIFSSRIAFNVLPATNALAAPRKSSGKVSGVTTALQVSEDVRKLVPVAGLEVDISCAFVPVFFGDTVYLRIDCGDTLDISRVREVFLKLPAVVIDDCMVGGPAILAATGSGIHVGELVISGNRKQRLGCWIVCDSLKAGRVNGLVSILRQLQKTYL